MTTIPVGSYWIGDPCYAVPNDQWHRVLDVTDMFNGATEVDGKFICAFSTTHGDGEYLDYEGRTYSVDSGTIGVTDARFVPEGKVPFSSYRLEITEPTEAFANGGRLVFGNIIIDTDDYDAENRMYDVEDDFDEGTVYDDEG